jgi:arylsulfatase A-like enzyme
MSRRSRRKATALRPHHHLDALPRALLFGALLFGALLLGALLPACSDGDRRGAGRVTLLPLVPDGAVAPDREARTVQRLLPDGTQPVWSIDGPDWSLVERDGGSVLRVDGGGARVRLGPLASDFNHVAVHGRFEGAHSFHLEISGAEGQLRLNRESADGSDVVFFSASSLRRWASPVEELAVAVRGPGCQIHSIELLDVPLEWELPPLDAPSAVGIGDVARQAVGLSGAEALLIELVAPRAGRLELAFGQPEQVRCAGRAPVVHVALEAGGTTREWRVPLESSLDVSASWHPLVVPLDDLTGQALRVRFALEPATEPPEVCAVATPLLVQEGAAPATVLLITSDTHRADHLGSAGLGVTLDTPVIDALAARGVTFTNCYSTTNVTSPSHTTLLTGLPPRDTGVVTNTDALAPAARTLAEVFAGAGYRTFAVVSAGQLGPYGTDLSQGFERMASPPVDGLPWDAGQALSLLMPWIEEARGQPLFVWLHLYDAHFPYDPPAEFLPERGSLRAELEAQPDPPLLPGTLRTELQEAGDLSQLRLGYRGEIRYLDDALRVLLEHPRMEAAVTAFTADHGEVLVRPETCFDHEVLLPDTLHVPLLLSWPAAPRGLRVDRPVEHLDLAATLLDVAGVTAEFPGESLVAALGPQERPPGPRFALSNHGASASVAVAGWFLVLHLRDHRISGRSYARHQVELYRLETDPGCREDLAGMELESARSLRRLLVDWLGQASETPLVEQRQKTAEQIARLAALGYTTDLVLDPGNAWIEPDCDCANCRALR